MKFAIAALLGATVHGFAKNIKGSPCLLRTNNGPQEGNVRTPLEPLEDLPEQVLWNNINGTSYLTNIRN